MALEEKYVRVFRNECDYLSYQVLDNLRNLSVQPQNIESLKSVVQTADTIIGDSRFVGDKGLENAAKMVVKCFTGITDARDKSDDLKFLTKVFEAIIIQN